jgi:hypothetical protein
VGDSLRQALIDELPIDPDDDTCILHYQEDGVPVWGPSCDLEDRLLRSIADWLDGRAKEMGNGSSTDNNTATAIRYVKAAALEQVRDEIRQELRDGG